MSEPTFAQPERRSLLLPILLALAAIALAAAVAHHFFPATTVNIDHVQTRLLPTETLFQGSTVIGQSERDRTLFVASTIRIENQLKTTIYLDDFHLTLTTPENTEETETGVQKTDLATLEQSFPQLKPLLTIPLLRNTAIEPGQQVEGTLLFAVKEPKDVWDARKSAVIRVDPYHLPALYTTIPKGQ
jgi:hypothetical protein